MANTNPIGRALRTLAAPALRSHGFEPSGTTCWTRIAGGRTQAIGFQQNRYNSSLAGSFTVNLMTSRRGATGQGRLEQARAARASRSSPAPFFADKEGWYGVRIGHLLPVHHDFWYAFDPAGEPGPDAAVAAMLADLEAYGLPWLADPWAHSPIRRGPLTWLGFRLFGIWPKQIRGEPPRDEYLEILQRKLDSAGLMPVETG